MSDRSAADSAIYRASSSPCPLSCCNFYCREGARRNKGQVAYATCSSTLFFTSGNVWNAKGWKGKFEWEREGGDGEGVSVGRKDGRKEGGRGVTSIQIQSKRISETLYWDLYNCKIYIIYIISSLHTRSIEFDVQTYVNSLQEFIPKICCNGKELPLIMPKMSSIESSGREGGKGWEGERRDILGGGERGGKGREKGRREVKRSDRHTSWL